MKKSFPWSISALLMFSCAGTVCAKDVSVPLDPLTEKVAHIAEEIYAQGLYPGISIAASGPNKVRVLYQIGHADVAKDRRVTTETVFRMYSVSKGLTRMLVAALVDEKAIALDAQAGNYLPDLPAHLQEITVQQLLDHTSGIRHYRGTDEWLMLSRQHCSSPVEALSQFSADPLLFAPGTRESYSSFGYVLLSAVLEKAGGASFGALLQKHVVDPSGAEAVELDGHGASRTADRVTVFYERGADGAFDVAFPIDNSCKFGGGGVNATPEAVLDIYEAFYSDEIAPPATLRKFVPSATDGQDRPYVSFGGEGLGGRSVAAAFPADGVIVVIAANARGGNLEPYARRIGEALLQ